MSKAWGTTSPWKWWKYRQELLRPVENVSWNHAVEFYKKLSYETEYTYRLISEAEWEYGCHAGDCQFDILKIRR
ncbi:MULTISPECIES: SUMF1/EgtB/PvdO family nonheme iron enzyme [Nostoc]|uniref:SUMF1/EgtB/PvdO family nonheme iron enzyme n=1 Tax=Nostoc paludosum FACHB-159 TaxID=2692908 RepID=A0ABR8KEX7_9NOSO|nr:MULTISPECIES: SUMF1/EgtB/PvdO family nonheme iron enzyme [Nostoc]MBD2681719.1 SUMF1/EgtB/PvdO family nonheme iron enzyme [Nostoc sp. FACHB-857]MBD2738126.1 SUMF1/EgtB/PvdO family nonheme iron enzyme [Nostoc paludosum FACHB-159]